MSDDIALQFLRPLWLWLLLALPLAAAWWRRRARARHAWRGAVDAHLLPHLLEDGAGAARASGLWLAIAAATLAILALAGPSWRTVLQPLQRGDAPLVVALDLSSATLANDLPPSRLLQARAKLQALLRDRDGGQVGLVAFADDAFTVAPLTDDLANVALFVDALAPDVMPVDGSRPARAIEQAVALLRRAGFVEGDVLLLASGASADDIAAASRTAALGFRVSVIGMGTPQGAAYRARDTRIARSRRDDVALAALATAGGGRYSPWLAGSADLAAVGALDAPASAAERPARDGVRIPQDGGYLLLPPLLLLMLLAFRRGGAPVALLLCLCLPALPLLPARAQQQATPPAPPATAWQRADQAAHARSREAEEAYRRGDFATAARVWQSLPAADAAYNRGNALARAGRLEDAIAAYDSALQAQPDMPDAVANRAAVRAALDRRPPPGPRDGSRGEQSPQPDQGQPQPNAGEPGGEGPGDPGEAPRGAAPDPASDPPPASPGTPPDDAAEAEARQRAADAAQRQRMDEAMAPSPPSDAAGPETDADALESDATPASAAEREQREADAAWLRRIPDEPGGLLRAKFQLEHERRQREGSR